jgi:UDP-glucose 4-epimerase
MKHHNIFKLVFSSSCTVYGEPETLPITEERETGKVTNVYGRTKYFIEEMLKDLCMADDVSTREIFLMKYFIRIE